MAGTHLSLSLLWVAGCLPVLTAPAATAALFEVTRLRRRDDVPYPGRAYVAALRRYLRPVFATGLGWAALGALLAADLVIAGRITGPAGDAVMVALLALAILYALVTVALFPVLVSFHARPRDQLAMAALVALLSPVRGLAALATVAAAVFAVWTVPLLILAVPSLVATALLRLYHGAVDRIRQPDTAPFALSPVRR